MIAASGVISGVLPWFSIDALVDADTHFPTREEVEICMKCTHCYEDCARCDGYGHIATRKSAGGRPKVKIDAAHLRGMMLLGKTNAEMCAALHISKNTLVKAKKEILKEEIQ